MRKMILPANFYEAAQNLEKDKRLAFYDAIFRFAFEDIEPVIEEPVLKAMFELAKNQIVVFERKEND